MSDKLQRIKDALRAAQDHEENMRLSYMVAKSATKSLERELRKQALLPGPKE